MELRCDLSAPPSVPEIALENAAVRATAKGRWRDHAMDLIERLCLKVEFIGFEKWDWMATYEGNNGTLIRGYGPTPTGAVLDCASWVGMEDVEDAVNSLTPNAPVGRQLPEEEA